MTKRIDTKQNKRINQLEKRLRGLAAKGKKKIQQKRPPLVKPRPKPRQQPRSTAASSLSKLGPVLGNDHLPGSSIPVTIMGKAISSLTSTDTCLLAIYTGNAIRKGAGTVDNPYQPFGGVVIAMNVTNGGILSITPFTDQTQAITDTMIEYDRDFIKYNSMKMTLKYNGASIYRMGVGYTVNPPDHNSIEGITNAVTSAIETPSLAEFNTMRTMLSSDRFSRIHHFNETVVFEEICAASHTWQPYTPGTNFLSIGTSGSVRTIVHAGVYYNLPVDCSMIFVENNNNTGILPSFTFGLEAHVELSLSTQPGLMTPTKPPSTVVTNAIHSLRTSIVRAAQHHDVPQKEALSKYSGAWTALATFSRSKAGKEIGRSALSAGLGLLTL